MNQSSEDNFLLKHLLYHFEFFHLDLVNVGGQKEKAYLFCLVDARNFEKSEHFHFTQMVGCRRGN